MAIEAFGVVIRKEEAVRSASASFYVSPTSAANWATDRVTVVTRFGLATVLAEKEETVIKDALVYTGRHSLGATRQQQGENVRKLCNTSVPCLMTPQRGLARPGSPHS